MNTTPTPQQRALNIILRKFIIKNRVADEFDSCYGFPDFGTSSFEVQHRGLVSSGDQSVLQWLIAWKSSVFINVCSDMLPAPWLVRVRGCILSCLYGSVVTVSSNSREFHCVLVEFKGKNSRLLNKLVQLKTMFGVFENRLRECFVGSIIYFIFNELEVKLKDNEKGMPVEVLMFQQRMNVQTLLWILELHLKFLGSSNDYSGEISRSVSICMALGILTKLVFRRRIFFVPWEEDGAFGSKGFCYTWDQDHRYSRALFWRHKKGVRCHRALELNWQIAWKRTLVMFSWKLSLLGLNKVAAVQKYDIYEKRSGFNIKRSGSDMNEFKLLKWSEQTCDFVDVKGAEDLKDKKILEKEASVSFSNNNDGKLMIDLVIKATSGIFLSSCYCDCKISGSIVPLCEIKRRCVCELWGNRRLLMQNLSETGCVIRLAADMVDGINVASEWKEACFGLIRNFVFPAEGLCLCLKGVELTHIERLSITSDQCLFLGFTVKLRLSNVIQQIVLHEKLINGIEQPQNDLLHNEWLEFKFRAEGKKLDTSILHEPAQN